MSKIRQEREDIHAMDMQVAQDKLNELRKELFSLQLNSATAHIKDYSRFRKLRQSIARVLTKINSLKKSSK